MNKVWRKWKFIADRVGNLQITLAFSILYYILLTPLGLLSSIFKDSLGIKSQASWSQIKDNTSKEKISRQ